MRKNLDRILEEIFKHEGGYVDHPKDPGGATNMGITRRVLAEWRKVSPWWDLPKSSVKTLSKAEAKEIYIKNYWNKVQGDVLPDGVDYTVADFGVNSGPSRSVKGLQTVLGVTPDGVIGPKTLEALRKTDPEKIIEGMFKYRMDFLRSLKTWDTFGEGWTSRVTRVRKVSLDLAGNQFVQEEDSPNILRVIIRLILKLLGR